MQKWAEIPENEKAFQLRLMEATKTQGFLGEEEAETDGFFLKQPKTWQKHGKNMGDAKLGEFLEHRGQWPVRSMRATWNTPTPRMGRSSKSWKSKVPSVDLKPKVSKLEASIVVAQVILKIFFRMF